MLKVLGLAALITTSHATSEKEGPKTASTEIAKVEPTNFSAGQKSDVNKLIEAYLEAHPEKVVAALEKFGKDQQAAAIKKLEGNATASKDKLLDPTNAIVLGKSDAASKLVVFVDPNCGHCRGLSASLNELSGSLDSKNVAILIRQWPILGTDSEFISGALIAAYKKDPKKYKELSEKVVASQKQLNKEDFLQLAKDTGVDTAALEKEATAANGQVDNTKELAKKMGLEGTPTAFLADKTGRIQLITIGTKENLEKVIADAAKA